MRATELLQQDHAHVEDLFVRLEQAQAGQDRQALLDEIGNELEMHAQVEEEIFYPGVADVSRRVDDARSAHGHVRSLISAAQGLDPGSPEFLHGVRTLRSAVLAHVAEEESGIFLEAGRMGDQGLEDLGRRIEERKEALKTSLLQRGKRAVKQAAQKVA